MYISRLILGFILLFCSSVMSQAQDESKEKEKADLSEIIKNFQISAYFQGQYQHGQKDVNRLGVGANNEHLGEDSFNRYGLRRAYISTLYQTGLVYGLVTLELKDRKIWFSDAFLNITDPWTKRFNLSMGSMNPMFGYELSVSPSNYELIEGTYFLYNLLPDIYDVGVKLNYQAPERYGNLDINISLVAGNGVQQETDSRRDFIGSISAGTSKSKPFRLSGGISYYNGSVYQGTENVYRMKDKEFVLDNNSKNLGKYAKREYLDLNAQLTYKSPIGLSELRGEYVIGTQPGSQFSNESPNSKERPDYDTYIRNFGGGYVYYLQQIGKKLPLTFFGGYSWYDPNTKVSGNNVGQYNTNSTDIKYQTVSLGLIWFPYPPIRVQAFYEIPFNEKSVHLSNEGFNRDRKDNVFTLRVQYKY
jgi:hypothetical protein